MQLCLCCSAEAGRKSRGHTETEEANPVFGSRSTHRPMGLLFVSLACWVYVAHIKQLMKKMKPQLFCNCALVGKKGKSCHKSCHKILIFNTVKSHIKTLEKGSSMRSSGFQSRSSLAMSEVQAYCNHSLTTSKTKTQMLVFSLNVEVNLLACRVTRQLMC